MDLHYPGRPHGHDIVATPAHALRHVGFSAHRLAAGERDSVATAATELCLVLLSGHASVECVHPAHGRYAWSGLRGRRSVFDDEPPYALYAPPGAQLHIEAISPLEYACCRAPVDATANAPLPPRLIEPARMRSLTRGVGSNLRYVREILPEDELAQALLVVEVRTPAGHSSSYPPHRHDRDRLPYESQLEETYYHRVHPPQGFVFQRIYTDERDLDVSLAVEDHGLVLVPRGYHPVCAPHGYASYYLNVMAGPRRLWRVHDDPAHAWLLALTASPGNGAHP